MKCYTKYLLQFYQKQTVWEEENNPKTSNIWDKKNFMVVGHKLNNVINGYNLFFYFHLSYSFNSLLMVSIVSMGSYVLQAKFHSAVNKLLLQKVLYIKLLPVGFQNYNHKWIWYCLTFLSIRAMYSIFVVFEATDQQKTNLKFLAWVHFYLVSILSSFREIYLT